MNKTAFAVLLGCWINLSVLSANEPGAESGELPRFAKARIGALRYWHGTSFSQAAFSADGRFLATAGITTRGRFPSGRGVDPSVFPIRVWETATGRLVHLLTGPTGHTHAIAYGGNERLASSDGPIMRIWDTKTGKQLRSWTAHDRPGATRLLAYLSDVRTLISCGADNELVQWDPKTGKQVRQIPEGGRSVRQLLLSSDDNTLLLLDEELLRLWDVAAAKELHRIDHEGEILHAAFSSDGKQLAIATQADVKVLDAKTAREIEQFTIEQKPIRQCFFAGDDRHIGWDTTRGYVLVVDRKTKEIVFQNSTSDQATSVVSRDGRYLVVPGWTWVRVWDMHAGQSLMNKARVATQGRSFAFSHDGRLLATRDGKQIQLRVARDCRVFSTIEAEGQIAAFSRDGRMLAGSIDEYGHKIGIWELATGSLIREIRAFSFDGLEFRDNDTILRASGISTFDYEIATGKRVGGAGRQRVDSYVKDGFKTTSSDEKTVARYSGGVIHIDDGEGSIELNGQRGGLRRLKFSPDGKSLVSSGFDGTLLIWDVERARLADKPAAKVPVVVKYGPGASQLHRAANMGQLDDVSKLLKTGARVNSVDEINGTPLHLAALQGNLDVVDALLAAGADATSRSNKVGQTPLHVACQHGNVDVVKRLLQQKKPPLDLIDGQYFAPLHLACDGGQLGVARLLIDAGADVNATADRTPAPLLVAARAGDLEMMRLLLERDANVDGRSRDDETVLMLVARQGQLGAVKLLVQHKADLKAASRDKRNALDKAWMAGHREVVKLLLNAGAGPSGDFAGLTNRDSVDKLADRLLRLGKIERQIETVVVSGDTDKLAEFLKFNSLLVHRRNEERTLLGLAVEKGRIEIVRLLLDAGADPDSRNVYTAGRDELTGTALHLAVQNGSVEVVQLLLDAGAELTHDRPGMSSVSIALALESDTPEEMVDLLLARKVDINTPVGDKAPLHVAVEKNNVSSAKKLLERGADPNVDHGYFRGSPLHNAAMYGRLEILKLMLEHGGNLKSPGYQGVTLLQSAAFAGQKEVVAFLVTRMLDYDIHAAAGLGDVERIEEILRRKMDAVHARLPDKRTPLHIAARRKQLAATKLLINNKADVNARDARAQTPLAVAYDREMKQLLTMHGGEVLSAEERVLAREGIDGKGIKTVLTGGGYAMFPGGEHHIRADNVYLLIRNVAGRRVAQYEVGEPGRRLNVTEDPDKDLQIIVTDSNKGKRTRTEFTKWDELKKANPAAHRLYERYRINIQAETLAGQHIFTSGEFGGHVPQPIVGLTLVDIAGGCKVVEVLADRGAEAAGIQVGDIVTKVSGHAVPSYAGLRNLVGRHNIGESIDVEIRRDGKAIVKKVEISLR